MAGQTPLCKVCRSEIIEVSNLQKKRIFDLYKKDLKSRGTSKYRGVAWHKNNQKWLASISHNKKRLNLGYYANEEDAAKAYDKAIVKYNKSTIKLNFREASHGK